MNRSVRRAGIAFLVASVLVAASCSSSGSDDASRTASEADQAGGEVVGDAEVARGAGDGASLQVATRHRVRTATVQLAVDAGADVGPTADRVSDLATSLGGTVDDDRRRHGEDGTAEMVVRVPPDQLEDLVAGLGDLAEVTSSAITTDDVTEEYTDLEGRIRNLRASVERIRALVAEADDVVQVASLESELSRREQDLELAEGRLRVLDEQVQLATVTVSIATRPAGAVDDDTDDAPAPMAALAGGWSAFVTIATWLLAGVLASLPFLATAAVVAVAVRAVRRRRPTPPPTGSRRGPDGPSPFPAPPAGAWATPGTTPADPPPAATEP